MGVPVLRDRDGSLHMYCLHLFAGRRRPGDCHDHLVAIGREVFPDVSIHLLGVDTAIDRCSGDLLAEGFQMAESLAAKGLIALTLTGPPCETWSEARFLEILNDAGEPCGPKPLRSASRLWGLRGLSAREVKQLQTGTQLMMRSHRIEFATALAGGGTLQEHPARPRDPDRPSTWITEFQVNYFQNLPHSVLWTFLQHAYGAGSLKPTTFRLTRLPGFGRVFNEMQLELSERLPAQTLGGRNAFDQGFKTAAAKEYPSPLCAAMLKASLTALRKRVQQEGFQEHATSELSPEENAWIGRMTRAASEIRASTFYADYQPGHS